MVQHAKAQHVTNAFVTKNQPIDNKMVKATHRISIIHWLTITAKSTKSARLNIRMHILVLSTLVKHIEQYRASNLSASLFFQ